MATIKKDYFEDLIGEVIFDDFLGSTVLKIDVKSSNKDDDYERNDD